MKGKDEEKSSLDRNTGTNTERPSANRGAKQQRTKPGVQGACNQSVTSSTGRQGMHGEPIMNVKQQTAKSKDSTPNPNQTPKAHTPQV